MMALVGYFRSLEHHSRNHKHWEKLRSLSGVGGIRFPHVKGFYSLDFKDLLNLRNNPCRYPGAGPKVPVLLEALK
jgi:hypothetical protein